MKNFKIAVLIIIWLVIGTHGYAYLWSQNLDAFPTPPEFFGRFVSNLTGEQDNSEVTSIVYMLFSSFIIVSAVTASLLIGFLFFKKNRG